MAGSVNRATILGNVGKDPEIRTLQNGTRLANFTVATSESWTDKGSGERKERTEWHRVSTFNGNLVNIIEKHVTKGTKVYLEGQIQTRKWTDQGGQERYSTEIVLPQFGAVLVTIPTGPQRPSEPSDHGERSAAPRTTAPARASTAPAWDAGGDLNDEIPF